MKCAAWWIVTLAQVDSTIVPFKNVLFSHKIQLKGESFTCEVLHIFQQFYISLDPSI